MHLADHQLKVLDSGVETGNDSNDSLVVQHSDNVAPMSCNDGFQKPQLSFIDEATPTSREVSIWTPSPISKGLEPLSSSDMRASASNDGSIVSVRSTDGCPVLSLALIPANEKAKIFELRLPPRVYDYSLPFLEKNQTPYRRKLKKVCSEDSGRNIVSRRFHYLATANERKMRLAASTNNIELMQMLLKAGVSPNNHDESANRTPLHLAASRGYTEMVSLLLSYGADPNRRDCIGNTPLHLAVVTGKISVVTLLLMAGSDVTSSDSHGYNPLQLAQTKLRVLQNYCKNTDTNQVKEEVRNVIGMLLAYLQKQKDAAEQVEALGNICSRLSLSNTSDELQEDVRSLLADINSLTLSN
ncbi:hypothetical protein QAD02_019034 [Eretmocerus hayati]|uniref:Uncharacterized protein n=1 Tax=Eretmocerus hayati TaxID=131215 RepID=A0ACC2PIP3_9HYME|nr:hypothetical protein QAD02_019034 [Eretmocerus hayati]